MIGTLTFSNINVPNAGGYFMTITYGDSDGPRTEEIRVNNGSPLDTKGTFPAGCNTRKLPITLNKTGNTISFANSGSKGITVLQIVISST